MRNLPAPVWLMQLHLLKCCYLVHLSKISGAWWTCDLGTCVISTVGTCPSLPGGVDGAILPYVTGIKLWLLSLPPGWSNASGYALLQTPNPGPKTRQQPSTCRCCRLCWSYQRFHGLRCNILDLMRNLRRNLGYLRWDNMCWHGVLLQG